MARYRPVYTGLWDCDDKFQGYSSDGKLLFVYLITNDHLGEAGIYKLTYKTMSNATELSVDKVKKLIKEELNNNVSYDDENHVVFVYKFLKFNGGGNPELLKKSINKDRKLIKTPLWGEFDKYYTTDLKLIENSLETDSAITNSNSNTKSNSNLIKTDEEIDIHNLLINVRGLGSIKIKKIIEFIKEISSEFPDVDYIESIKKKITWWQDNPSKAPDKKKTNVLSQLRNWFRLQQKWIDESKKQDDVGRSYKKPPRHLDFEAHRQELVEYLQKTKSKSDIKILMDAAEMLWLKIKIKWYSGSITPKRFFDILKEELNKRR